MHILADNRWKSTGGIGRFYNNVIKCLDCKITKTSERLSPFNPLGHVEIYCSSYYRDIDVVFTPGVNPPICTGKPYVFTIHDIIPIDCPKETDIVKQLYFNNVLKLAAHEAECVLTVSEYSKQKILDWIDIESEKVIVVGNAVGEQFNPYGPVNKTERPYILYVGNKKPHKNVCAAVRAYAESGVQERVDMRLTGSPTNDILEIANETGVRESIVFEGFISEKELPMYYRGAIALAHASVQEGFGLPILESMACGTPVIAFNGSAIPEVTDGAAILVDTTDTAEFAHAIRSVVHNKKLRKELRNDSLVRASVFSWQKVSERVESALLRAAKQQMP